MLLNIGLALIALWFIGFIVLHVTAWLIHIFLVVAVIMILVQLIRGK